MLALDTAAVWQLLLCCDYRQFWTLKFYEKRKLESVIDELLPTNCTKNKVFIGAINEKFLRFDSHSF